MKRRSQTSSDPLSVGRLMSRLMARTGYDREQSTSAVADAWREAAPPGFRDASQPGNVRRGVLDVFVSHSAHVQELVPDAGISDIRCRLLADGQRTT